MKNLLNTFLNKDNNSQNARLSWLDELSHLDEVSGLKLSIKHITSILNDANLSLSEKIDLLITIDNANNVSTNQQISAFAKAENLKVEIANQMIDSNYAYHRIVFLAYTKLIELSFNKVANQQPDNNTKLTLLTRSLITAWIMLRWRFLEHAQAPANLWSQVIKIYQYADEHLLVKQKFQAYSDSEETNINTLLLQVLMLGSLSFNNLSKAQLEIISELLPIWMKDVRLKNKMEPYHVFYIDFSKDQAACRIRKSTPTGQCLFWDLDEIEYTIDTTIADISNHKTPTLLSKVTFKSPQLLKDTLIFLKKEWSKHDYVRQRRKESRQAISNTASVSVGVNHVFDLLKQFNNHPQHSARSLLDGNLDDRRLTSSVVTRGTTNTLVVGREKWNITDESDLGLGTLIPSAINPQLRPNKLFAVLNKFGSTKPAIGAVRNIKQMSGGQLKIGLEIFTDKPNLVSLKKFDIKKSPTEKPATVVPIGGIDFMAIHLPQSVLIDTPASLILPKIEFIPNTFYEIVYKNKREIIKLDEALEVGDDWVRVSFPEELQ